MPVFIKHGLDTDQYIIKFILDDLPQLYTIHSLLGVLAAISLIGLYSIDQNG